MLTARDVADRLGFSIDTVLRWTREGKLRGYRISGTAHGRLRYLEDDLEELLAERATMAAPVREAPATRPDAAAAEAIVPLASHPAATRGDNRGGT